LRIRPHDPERWQATSMADAGLTAMRRIVSRHYSILLFMAAQVRHKEGHDG
jgi:hypothetical protein